MDSLGKVLVVDDEKGYCYFMREYLGNQGYLVDLAYDGNSAVKLMSKNQYELILFDCNMPELSGAELIPIISQKNPKARKVMISAYNCIDEQFAKELGVDDFLCKPFSLSQIDNLLPGRPSRKTEKT